MKYLPLIIALLLGGCMSLNKATKKVLDSKDASYKVFRSVEKDYPCVVDTFRITTSDTTITIDTLRVDSVYAKDDTIYVEKFVYRTRTIRDTVKTTIIDNRALKLALIDISNARDSINQFKVEIERKNTLIAEAETDAAKQKNKAVVLVFIIIGMVVAAGVYVYVKLRI